METLQAVIPTERAVAVVDYENSQNCGDKAIWLGQTHALKRLGLTSVYTCTLADYDRDVLKQRLGDGTILVRGGGNFGDLYPYHKFHRRIVKDFPENKILMFPQTAHFQDPGELAETRRIFNAHSDLTMLARDVESYVLMRQAFHRNTVILCPDIAFALPSLRRRSTAAVDIVWVARTDREGRYGDLLPQLTMLGVEKFRREYACIDRLDGERLIARFENSNSGIMLTDWYSVKFERNEGKHAYESLDYDQQAQFVVRQALNILSRGRVVITDRLHGHILCLMLGIPHILLDNSYGKNRRYFNAWTYNADVAH